MMAILIILVLLNLIVSARCLYKVNCIRKMTRHIKGISENLLIAHDSGMDDDDDDFFSDNDDDIDDDDDFLEQEGIN